MDDSNFIPVRLLDWCIAERADYPFLHESPRSIGDKEKINRSNFEHRQGNFVQSVLNHVS